MDILAIMLNAGIGGAAKTRIMAAAYVSYTQLGDYLSALLRNGLLSQEGTTYTTTTKGMEFLNHYNAMSDLVPLMTEASIEEAAAIPV